MPLFRAVVSTFAATYFVSAALHGHWLLNVGEGPEGIAAGVIAMEFTQTLHRVSSYSVLGLLAYYLVPIRKDGDVRRRVFLVLVLLAGSLMTCQTLSRVPLILVSLGWVSGSTVYVASVINYFVPFWPDIEGGTFMYFWMVALHLPMTGGWAVAFALLRGFATVVFLSVVWFLFNAYYIIRGGRFKWLWQANATAREDGEVSR